MQIRTSLLCLILGHFALPAAALQVTLQNAIYIRLLQGTEAHNFDASGRVYLLKSGSVVEIPDQVVVEGADGQPDLAASLANWVNNPALNQSFNGVAGNYHLRNVDVAQAGTEAKPLVPVRVISAAEGSVVPSSGPVVHLGLYAMAVEGRLQVKAVPAVKIETVPNLLANDPRFVFPLPTIDRVANAERIAEIIAQANTAAEEVGTPTVVCPSGTNCGQTSVGTEESSVACEYVFKWGYPANLVDTYVKRPDAYKEIAAWFQGKMSDPTNCKDACPTTVAVHQSNLDSACASLRTCNNTCSTTKIDGFWCNGRGISSEEEGCKSTCSPFRGMSYNQRSSELKNMYKAAFNDLLANNPRIGNKMAKSGNAEKQAMRMLCLNKIRENPALEPMDANCDSSAIGFGQVVKMTFYETLGLNNQTLRRCGDMKIGLLAAECSGFNKATARLDIYGTKYDHLTPKQLYERRAFDIDLQVRSSYGVWVNKMQYFKYNTNSSFTGWFGMSDSSKRERINACTENGDA